MTQMGISLGENRLQRINIDPFRGLRMLDRSLVQCLQKQPMFQLIDSGNMGVEPACMHKKAP